LSYYDGRFVEERERWRHEYRKQNFNSPLPGPLAGLKLRVRQYFWAMYPERRIRNPGGIIYEAAGRGPEDVRALVLGVGRRNLYVIRNLSWPGSEDALRSGLERGRRFRLVGSYEARGLRVFKYSLEEGPTTASH
jgi:hypothetical protein